jgi:Acetyltransferase (GNAT) domain
MTIEATAALLEQVFPGTRVSRPDYLSWLYEQNPFGAVVETNLDDEQGRAGHYAVTPLELSFDRVSRQAGLSLNTAVHERARGGGVFVRLANDTFDAVRERGVDVVIGVANANSTPGFLRRLEFELVTPLPATVLLPSPGRDPLRSGWASDDVFAPGGLAVDAERLLQPANEGIEPHWTTESLGWRLSAPAGRYALHRGEDVLVVSTVDRRKRVPVAVLLAIFAAAPLDGAATRAVVRAACRFHRAPLALHVGVNAKVGFRGLPLPEWLRESPLNLIYRDLSGAPRSGEFQRLEFLDFDAY